jgi:predicted metal-dependent enzyme (double-stranded beta helix superfamily)
LIGWPPGRGLELHDHGDSCGTIYVVEGSLFETYTTLSAAHGGRGLRHRELTTGSLVAFGPEHIHDVVNHGPGRALSIHLYTPRLRSMTFYEHVPSRGLIPVRTDLALSETVAV